MYALRQTQPVRTARNATQRRLSKKERARYRTLLQFSACLSVALVLFMAYLSLNAHLTSLNYKYVKAQRERAALQAQTAHLDERLASLRGDDRLSAIAAKLHMSDPQQFALVALPAPESHSTGTHLAFLSSLAGFFGAK